MTPLQPTFAPYLCSSLQHNHCWPLLVRFPRLLLCWAQLQHCAVCHHDNALSIKMVRVIQTRALIFSAPWSKHTFVVTSYTTCPILWWWVACRRFDQLLRGFHWGRDCCQEALKAERVTLLRDSLILNCQYKWHTILHRCYAVYLLAIYRANITRTPLANSGAVRNNYQDQNGEL